MFRHPIAIAFATVLALSLATDRSACAAPLTLVSGDTVTFDTTAATYSGTVSGSGSIVGGIAVFGFDSVDLPTGVTVSLTGSNSISIQSSAGFSLGTTIDASGTGQTGAVGGGSGGNLNTAGSGTGAGGGAKDCCYGGGGGGYGGAGGTGPFPIGNPGATYGDLLLTTLEGGSGGGGGGNCCGSSGNVGGAGGGAIELVATGGLSLASTAQLFADGANGSAGNSNRTGGGGSGGAIRLEGGTDVSIAAGAVVSADGGTSLTSSGGAGNRVGGGGGGGRIAIESAGTYSNAGTLSIGGGFAANNDPSKEPNDERGAAGTIGLSLAAASPPSNLVVSSGSLTIDTSALTITDGGGAVLGVGSNIGGITTFSFDSIDLGAGASVTLQGDFPLSLQANGDISIATILDASGGDGTARSGAVSGVGGTAPGGEGLLGSGDGGRGGLGTGATPGLDGEGDGGGGGQGSCCGGGSGGGYGGEGGFPNTDTAAAAPVGAIYGDATISDLLAGSGGGGGAGTNGCCPQGGGGGGGGGAIELAAMGGTVTISATGGILADGGDGAGVGSNGRNGGGGSGGAIRITSTESVTVDGLLSVDGGLSHLTSSRGGGGGGGGRIYITAPELLLGGVPQVDGFLASGALASALGGPGSSDAAGGTPGAGGTILFQTPEPGTLLLVFLGGMTVLGQGRRRRRG